MPDESCPDEKKPLPFASLLPLSFLPVEGEAENHQQKNCGRKGGHVHNHVVQVRWAIFSGNEKKKSGTSNNNDKEEEEMRGKNGARTERKDVLRPEYPVQSGGPRDPEYAELPRRTYVNQD